MAQVLVRNLDENIVLRLKEKAANENMSLEQYLRDLLRKAVMPNATKAETLELADAIRNQMPRVKVDPTDIISADRSDNHDRA